MVPLSEKEAFADVFKIIAKSGLASFLVVLKKLEYSFSRNDVFPYGGIYADIRLFIS